MAQFPYLLTSGFEKAATNFDTAITDTESKSTYPHYSELVTRHRFSPWRGSYCWLIDQSTGGGTTTEVLQTQAGCNISADYYWAVGFAFYAKDTTMGNGDRTTIFELDSGTTTNEVTLQLYYTTAGGLQLLLTETASTAVGTNPVCALTENAWHWVELYGKVDDGASNDGTAYLVLDGYPIGNLSSLDQAAITDAYCGLTGQDATHTAGVYAFDDVTIVGTADSSVYSQARVGYRHRYPMNPHISCRSNTLDTTGYGEHLFIGPGTVDGAQLLTSNTDDTLELYDTDIGYTEGSWGLVAECSYSSGNPVISGPLKFERGCYALITAGSTNGARAIVNISPAPPAGYPAPYCYGNEANLKYHAKMRPKLPAYA